MKNKFIIFFSILSILFMGGIFVVGSQRTVANSSPSTQTASMKSVSSEISADGAITAQNQAVLHFQTPGKVTYLPFKEGDTVSQGQIIASLDTYALQRQLTTALNTYKVNRDTFDQAQQNSQDNVLQSQQQPSYAQAQMDKGNAINDAVKRIADQNQANLDTAVVNVELANYAQSLATLTSPLNGLITHEDISVPYVNVTTTTSFTVADMSTLVFRANIADTDIDYISQGSRAKVILDGSTTAIQGTVSKIYPGKISLPSGGQGYQVDVTADAIMNSKLDQAGTVLIQSNTTSDVMLVPAWTVLGNNSIWVTENNKPVLKTITIGKTHGNMIEVTGGLSSEDAVITNPEMIPAKEYQML